MIIPAPFCRILSPSAARSLVAMTLLVPVAATSGCLFEEPERSVPVEEEFTEACIPEAWSDAQDDEVGVLTSFSLAGAELVIDGETPTVETIEAPMAMAPAGPEPGVFVFERAVVEGTERGTLVLRGAVIAADAGRLVHEQPAEFSTDDEFTQIWPAPQDDDGWRPLLGPDVPPEDRDALAQSVPVALAADQLRLTDYDEAYLVTDTATLSLVGSFSVSAERLYWDEDSLLFAQSVTAQWTGDVLIGMTPSAGELRGPQGPTQALPMLIMGRDASLRAGAGFVETLEDMTVVQALADSGSLLESQIEVRACEPETVVMAPGEARRLRLSYRQEGGTVDAVVHRATIVDVDNGHVWSDLDIEPVVPDALVGLEERYPGTSWSSGLVEVLTTLMESIGAAAHALGCVFTLGFACAQVDDGPALPLWIEAGALGEFDAEVIAPSQRGTYELELRVEGTNFDEVVVPLTVIVDQ